MLDQIDLETARAEMVSTGDAMHHAQLHLAEVTEWQRRNAGNPIRDAELMDLETAMPTLEQAKNQAHKVFAFVQIEQAKIEQAARLGQERGLRLAAMGAIELFEDALLATVEAAMIAQQHIADYRHLAGQIAAFADKHGGQRAPAYELNLVTIDWAHVLANSNPVEAARLQINRAPSDVREFQPAEQRRIESMVEQQQPITRRALQSFREG
jgi:hypothetical protein